MTEGLAVPRDLDLGDRASALEQLKVPPAAHSQMASMVKDVLPEQKAGLLIGSRQGPLLAARMQKMGESDGAKAVGEHLVRLGTDTSWKENSGSALVGRLVDATLHSLTAPPSAPPAPASRVRVCRRRALLVVVLAGDTARLVQRVRRVGVVTETEATGYDCLSSRLVSESELRAFLLDCFESAECQLFVGHEDRVSEELRDVLQDVVFSVFCTYRETSGHFSMALGVSIEGWLADRVGRREFAERFAAHFDAYVLYGDTEPPGLWTVILADGNRLRGAMDEGDNRYMLYAATAPVPGLPDIRVDEGLWQLR
ncbi:hypothetical protein ACFCZ1_22340 [Streptomyces sp. NPDC056224]|uniref:hypothetical protein n=1 Tax=Streptomyces sp. NPDC056224 TaxID=3345750 RepID=UPI0035E05258